MARLALYYVDNHKIEIVKTLLGKEKVLLNGAVISEKKSEVGTEHTFEINKSRYRVVQRESSNAEKMNAYEIRKDGSPIALVNVVPQNSNKILVLIIAIGLGAGFIFGVIIYRMFFPVVI